MPHMAKFHIRKTEPAKCLSAFQTSYAGYDGADNKSLQNDRNCEKNGKVSENKQQHKLR